MKRLGVIELIIIGILFLMGALNCSAQQVPQDSNPHQQRQQVNIPCDNPTDCALKVQYDNDLQALFNAQQAVKADVASYMPVLQAQQAQETQTALAAQLVTDQANLQKFQSAATAISTKSNVRASN